MLARGALLTALSFASVGAISSQHEGLDNGIYCTGNCDDPVTTVTTPGYVQMGGSTDVDDAFEWMIQNANGGDFVVLRTSGSDGYNDYIYDMGGVNSVTTIVTRSRAGAVEREVLDIVRGAEAIFFAGGDQSTYLDQWKGNEMEEALKYCIHEKNITVGGTSAGLHIQGEFVYTGATGSIVSSEALSNPYHRYMDLAEGFLDIPYLDSVVTDSHFYERDRMGRSITFLSRLHEGDFLQSRMGFRAICVDERTAVLLDQTGRGVVVGRGYAYFLDAPKPAEVCQPNTPLTHTGIGVYKISSSGSNQGTFDFRSWSGQGGTSYQIDADRGRLYSTQSGGSVY